MAKNQFTLERGEAKALLMCGDVSRSHEWLKGVTVTDGALLVSDGIVVLRKSVPGLKAAGVVPRSLIEYALSEAAGLHPAEDDTEPRVATFAVTTRSATIRAGDVKERAKLGDAYEPMIRCCNALVRRRVTAPASGVAIASKQLRRIVRVGEALSGIEDAQIILLNGASKLDAISVLFEFSPDWSAWMMPCRSNVLDKLDAPKSSHLERNQGQCRDWDKALKHDWQDAMIAWTQRRIDSARGVF